MAFSALRFVVLMTSLGTNRPDFFCCAVVSPEKIELDLASRRNSAYIHWKRPGLGHLRKEPYLNASSADEEVEAEVILPRIPEGEMNRLIDAIQRSGQTMDEFAQENGGNYPDSFFSTDKTVNALVTRANRGDQEVLDQVDSISEM